MRKLKLEVQITTDGFIADLEGSTDWAKWNWAQEWTWDKSLQQIHTSSDCMSLSRKFVDGDFLQHWESFNNKPNDPAICICQSIIDMRKVVFSNSLTELKLDTVEIVGGNLTEQVLKQQPVQDMVVYGGARFVTALLDRSLIDEIYLFVNPVAIGIGLTIFDQGSRSDFKLK